jgi:hypothetical protein
MTTATPTRTRQPRRQPRQPRSVTVLQRPGDQADGRLLVTEGTDSALYFLREIPTQIPGRAFCVEKFGSAPGEGYDVLVGDRPADSACCCKGFTYCGHCRHVEALAALLARNLI